MFLTSIYSLKLIVMLACQIRKLNINLTYSSNCKIKET